jgi:hypothetical protein
MLFYEMKKVFEKKNQEVTRNFLI